MCSCGQALESIDRGVKMVQKEKKIKIKIITLGRDRSNRKSRRAKFSGHNDGHSGNNSGSINHLIELTTRY